MNFITPKYRTQFKRLRNRGWVMSAYFSTLFTRPVSDRWPLQSRISQYSFLDGLSSRDRDLEVLRDAIQCWIEICNYGNQIGEAAKYVCCIVVDTQVMDEMGMLWPEIFFLNTHFEWLSKLNLVKNGTRHGLYIEGLLKELPLPAQAAILEERLVPDNGSYMVYVDFDADKDKNRLTFRSNVGNRSPF